MNRHSRNKLIREIEIYLAFFRHRKEHVMNPTTLDELIQVADDEGIDPNSIAIVIPIGGVYFTIISADEQDSFNPNYWVFSLEKISEERST